MSDPIDYVPPDILETGGEGVDALPKHGIVFQPETRAYVQKLCSAEALALLDEMDAFELANLPPTAKERLPILTDFADKLTHITAELLEKKDQVWKDVVATYEEYYKGHPDQLLAFKQSFTKSAFEGIGRIHTNNGGLGAGAEEHLLDITQARLEAAGVPDHKFMDAMVAVDKWAKLNDLQETLQNEAHDVINGVGIPDFEWDNAIAATGPVAGRSH